MPSNAYRRHGRCCDRPARCPKARFWTPATAATTVRRLSVEAMADQSDDETQRGTIHPSDSQPCIACEGLHYVTACPNGASSPMLTQLAMGWPHVDATTCKRSSGDDCRLASMPAQPLKKRLPDATEPPVVHAEHCIGCACVSTYARRRPRRSSFIPLITSPQLSHKKRAGISSGPSHMLPILPYAGFAPRPTSAARWVGYADRPLRCAKCRPRAWPRRQLQRVATASAIAVVL